MSPLPTFVPVVRFKAELFFALSYSVSVCFLEVSFPFVLSLSLSRSLLLLLLSRPRQRQEYFLLLHGRVLPGISHHVITVIFSALRQVALPFLPSDSLGARTRRRKTREEFVRFCRKRSSKEIDSYYDRNFSLQTL